MCNNQYELGWLKFLFPTTYIVQSHLLLHLLPNYLKCYLLRFLDTEQTLLEKATFEINIWL